MARNKWLVVNTNAIVPDYGDIGKYLNKMEAVGWNLEHVDQGNLYLKFGDSEAKEKE